MEFQDHDYASTTHDKDSSAMFTYKMNSKEVEHFVKLRVSNNNLFSGRRNTSMWAWRAILRHMGLQHKMSHSQASKKWENMKKRYKELKNPPEGTKVYPELWPYFSLMDDAMEGRLEASGPILKASPIDINDSEFLPISRPKKRKAFMVMNCSTPSSGPEIEVSLNEDGDSDSDSDSEVDQESCVMDSERHVMDREKQVMERERLVLQRERAVLEREIAALDRDRASLEREKATIEREKEVMERERAMMKKDRDALSRDRLALEQDKARLEKLLATKEQTEGVTGDGREEKESDDMDRKERFLNLFEKLLENF